MRERREIRRGLDVEQRRAIRRARRTTRGAASTVARIAAVRIASNDVGADHTLDQGTKSPTRSRTAAAVPLRLRWMMNRTATLNRAVDEETAPRTIMNWCGPPLFLPPTDASVAAAPPLSPGSQDTAAPAAVPRSAHRASSRDRDRKDSNHWAGIPPDGPRRPTSRVGRPKSPEKRGNRTGFGSSGRAPRKVTIPRTAARACTQAARRTRRTGCRPRYSVARTAPRRTTRKTAVHGRNRSANSIGSLSKKRRGTTTKTANAVPRTAPRAAKATALAPFPARSRRWPGSVARAVSSVGAPRNTLGMKLKTEWLEAIATRKQERSMPVRRGSLAASGIRIPRNPLQAPRVASSRAATLLTWSPGDRPVTQPTRTPRKIRPRNASRTAAAFTTSHAERPASTSSVHVAYGESCGVSGGPQPPPPGVSMTRTSPRRSSNVTFAGSVRWRPPLRRRFRPGRPSPPPASPLGRRARRSERMETVPRSPRNRSDLLTPSPPGKRPRPPLFGMSRYSSTRSGVANSRASTGVFRVFVMWVWTPDIPGRYGNAPSPPAIVS